MRGARAAEPHADDPARLPALLRAGADAFKAKKWPACIAAYTDALRIAPSTETQGRLGLCEEAAGSDLDAFEHLASALHAAGVNRRGEQYKRFGDAFSTLSARVVQVYIATEPPDSKVIVDGRPRGKADGVRLTMKPGPHTFAARHDGYEDATEVRILVAGASPSIYLSLKPKPAPVVPAKPSAAPKPSTPAKPSAGTLAPFWYLPSWSLRGAFVGSFYTSATIALVSSAVALGSEVERTSLASGLPRDACAPGHAMLPPQCQAINDRRARRDDAELLIAAGAAWAGVSAGFLALSYRFAGDPDNPTIAPSVGSNGGGIVISGAW